MSRQLWGQHFLVNPNIQKAIVDACRLGSQDQVLEIGPGHGELTQWYIDKTEGATLIEVDSRLHALLRQKWGQGREVNIIAADIRKLSLESIPFKEPPVVVSNLPYYCSKPALEKILNWAYYKRAVIMIQRELAWRLLAAAGNTHRSASSLLFQRRAQGRLLFEVLPQHFKPAPEVASAVIEFVPKKQNTSTPTYAKLRHLIRAAFLSRRKTILNNLRRLEPRLNPQDLKTLLDQAQIKHQARAQEIELENFESLAQLWPWRSDQEMGHVL